MISIKVPPLGESIVEATVSHWRRNEGDAVAAGETLVELETDKVTVDVPAGKAGILVRRAHQEGDVVKVGDLLAEVDESPGGVAERHDTPVAPAPVAPAPALVAQPVAPPPESLPESSSPPRPMRASPAATRMADESRLDLGRVSGTGLGGVVSKPDVIDALRRAEAARVAPVPAPIATPAPVPPGAPMPSPARATATPRPRPETPSPATQSVAAPPSAPPPQVDVVRPEPPRVFTSVEEQANAAVSGEVAGETRERMSTRRRRIAEHLLEAQHATAHLTTFNEIDMSAVESLRTRVRDRIEKERGVRLTMMPFFVRAACLALRDYPMINARADGDEIVYRQYVHMGIAVASEAGLVVPNVKYADRKGIVGIGREIAELAKAARDGRLTMDDLTGGTFTITNGGVFGSLLSTPIINYPQSAILGLHKTQDRPVVVNGSIVIRPMMYVALSYDHRIIDGQHAVLFLVRIRELMEEPALLAID